MLRMARSAAELLARYREGPGIVRAAFDGFERAQPAPPRGEGEWTAHDIVVHLADAEVVRAVRFRVLLGEDDPSLFAFDQDRWQSRLAYPSRSPELALAVFETMVRSSLELLSAMPPEALSRTAPHPDGPLSCLDLLERGIAHARDHAAQIASGR